MAPTTLLHRLALSVALVAASVVGTVTPAAEAAPAPNAVKLWAATQGGDQTLTLAQARSNATNFQMIVGRPVVYRPYIAALRRIAPETTYIMYMNGLYAQQAQGTMYPESWYARDAAGRKITSIVHGNYLMDPSNPAWVASRSARCALDTRVEGWDGCYLDMLGPGPLFPGYNTAIPINPRTGQEWNVADWMTTSSAIGAAVQRANPTRMVTANGLGTGTQYFDRASGLTKQLLDGIAAANSQGFVRGTSVPINQFRTPETWKRDVDMLAEAGSRGKGVMAMTKIWHVPATEAQKNAVMHYTLATFLLGTDGIHSYLYFSDDGAEDAYAQTFKLLQNTYVGQPTAGYVASADGTFTRRFTSGFAAVNPGDTAVTITLPRTMKTVGGNAVASIRLAPQSGEVLTF